MPINLWGLLYLLVLGLLLPLLATQTARLLDSGLPSPPRWAIYAETVFWLSLIYTAARFVSRSNRLALFPLGPVQPIPTFLAVVVLLLTIPVRWTTATDDERRRLLMLVPHRRNEWTLWAIVSLVAGITEETAYRGVMFGLLRRLTGHSWISAVLTALAFALGHQVQGRGGVAIIFVFALGFQALYALTGGLSVPIVVHVLYDLLAGLLFARLGSRRPDPADPPVHEGG